MPRHLLASAAAVALLAFGGQASAQVSCQPRLQNVAQRVSELPGGTSPALVDRLNELYDEALALEEVEPSRCLAVVMQMEALLAGGGRTGANGGGAAGGGAQLPGGQPSIETQDGDRIAETPVLPVPPLEPQRGSEIRGPNAFTDSVVNYWTESSVHERGLLLGAATDYIEELREIAEEVVAQEEDEDAKRRKARAANVAIHAVEVYQHVVLVNEPEDMLAARQMDALYRLRESTRRAMARWARDELMKDEFEPAPLERPFEPAPLVRDDFLAPLVRPSSSSDSSAGGDDFLAPLTRPEDQSFMARVLRRVSQAEAKLQQVRADVAYWIEDRMID